MGRKNNREQATPAANDRADELLDLIEDLRDNVADNTDAVRALTELLTALADQVSGVRGLGKLAGLFRRGN